MALRPHSTLDYITVGLEAIRLLKTPGINQMVLLKQMEKYMLDNNLMHVLKKDFKHTLQQHIPGLCGMNEIPFKVLWSNPPVNFYHMPDAVFILYQQGYIDNGTWCDHVSRVRPNLYTPELIAQIHEAGGDKSTIKRIVGRLKG